MGCWSLAHSKQSPTGIVLSEFFFVVAVSVSGSMVPADVETSPAYDLQQEDPRVYAEDRQSTDRFNPKRHFSDTPLPSTTTTAVATSSSQGQVSVGIEVLKQLHQLTGDILRGAGQNVVGIFPVHLPPVPGASPQSQELEKGAKKCPRCWKVFRESYKCKIHYQTVHMKVTKWKCKKCGKSLSSRDNLDSHMDTMHKYRNFQCIICQRGFENKSA